MAATSLLFPPPKSFHFLSSKTNSQFFKAYKPCLKGIRKSSKKRPNLYRIYAAEDALGSSEAAQQIVSTTASSGDETVSSVVSALLFSAFIGLSLLTLGVIYLAIQDFLQKRERDRFEKEEAERKKKGGKKKTAVRARSGPKGFGQKVEDEEEDD